MKLSELSVYVAAKYEALFLRRLALANGGECSIPHGGRSPRRRFSIADAIFPTEAILPRSQY